MEVFSANKIFFFRQLSFSRNEIGMTYFFTQKKYIWKEQTLIKMPGEQILKSRAHKKKISLRGVFNV